MPGGTYTNGSELDWGQPNTNQETMAQHRGVLGYVRTSTRFER